jgi:hypothetical protein
MFIRHLVVNTIYEKGDRATSIYSSRILLKKNVSFGKLEPMTSCGRLEPDEATRLPSFPATAALVKSDWLDRAQS